jgi:type IV pilus assembly protein PilQ
MVEPLCSKEGKITVTPESEIGIASNAEEAGGDALAGKDCLLVVDYPQNVEAITKVIAQIDVRPKQVLIEATILRAQLNENNALGIDFNLVGGVDFQALNSTSNGITNINVGNLPQAELQNTSFTGQTDFNTAIPDGGLTFGIIKNSVAVFIRALEQVTDVSVLANPKIPALNKQRGEVIVGRRDGYITTTITETVATQTVEFLETGTQLVFRPFIGNDGYVRMEVHPEDSTGGLTAANLPFEQTTEVTTNIIVRDGHTILLGGLFREVTTAGRDQLPLLGNIPIAGVLFRNTRDSTQREEVIILLTIHIIKDNDSVDLAGAEAEEDIERYRVGMRQGLQWYGRERLAQAHYRWALDHLAKGHMSKAMWDLDLAINNNPKFMAAIKLKEKLLDGHQWDDDSSSVRGFLMDLIMQEQGLISPIFGWPGPPFEYPLLRGPGGFDQGKDADAQTFLAPSPEAELPPSDNAGKGDS